MLGVLGLLTAALRRPTRRGRASCRRRTRWDVLRELTQQGMVDAQTVRRTGRHLAGRGAPRRRRRRPGRPERRLPLRVRSGPRCWPDCPCWPCTWHPRSCCAAARRGGPSRWPRPAGCSSWPPTSATASASGRALAPTTRVRGLSGLGRRSGRRRDPGGDGGRGGPARARGRSRAAGERQGPGCAAPAPAGRGGPRPARLDAPRPHRWPTTPRSCATGRRRPHPSYLRVTAWSPSTGSAGCRARDSPPAGSAASRCPATSSRPHAPRSDVPRAGRLELHLRHHRDEPAELLPAAAVPDLEPRRHVAASARTGGWTRRPASRSRRAPMPPGMTVRGHRPRPAGQAGRAARRRRADRRPVAAS